MIESVSFTNFKGLSGQTVEFGDLTLLTGVNGAGKSSVIQALLLIALGMRRPTGIVPLNDDYGLMLGEGSDIVWHNGNGSTDVEFKLKLFDGLINISFRAEPSARYMTLFGVQPGMLDSAVHSLQVLQYLAAERDGPREAQELPSLAPENVEVGYRGQYTAAVLAANDLAHVPPHLEHPSIGKLRFTKQVEAWLSSFVPGVQLRWEIAPEFGKATLRFKYDDPSDEWLRPGNVGFGVTYCLPIVVAGLLAKKGTTLIIDTPEAHLHPSAQSEMGKFLSRVATGGVQVIVETHSDHIINGIRLATLLKEFAPPTNRVVINYFSRNTAPRVRRILISPRGELSERPRDFFDQSERDLAQIVHLRLGSSRNT